MEHRRFTGVIPSLAENVKFTKRLEATVRYSFCKNQFLSAAFRQDSFFLRIGGKRTLVRSFSHLDCIISRIKIRLPVYRKTVRTKHLDQRELYKLIKFANPVFINVYLRIMLDV